MAEGKQPDLLAKSDVSANESKVSMAGALLSLRLIISNCTMLSLDV